MCEAYSDWLVELFDYVFSRFHFDFMSFAEDMSYNSGPMISKECFDEFLAPFYRKVIPVIHKHGIPVFIDSDGDITMAVDWYASVGADGMFPLERQAGVDVSTYLDKQPQMAFLGHFDKMCMKHGAQAMRAEFERILPSMQRGKVISSVDHQTPPDVSMEHYKAYVALLHEYAAKVTHKDGNITPCPVFDTAERSKT
jgi:uroporphyrinogen-III decarboxylase